LTGKTPAARDAVGSATPLRFLPLAIRIPKRPLSAVAVGWLTAFPASILLSFVWAYFFPTAAPPEFDMAGWPALVALVIVAPLFETLIMGMALLLLLAFLPPAAAIVVSAAGWGVAHSLIAPTWGLVIWWPFLIFSTLFVAWRGRSLFLAFAIPATVHGLQNLIPAMLVAQGLA
jgi:hypothetical protein